jgi:hypothetical protein
MVPQTCRHSRRASTSPPAAAGGSAASAGLSRSKTPEIAAIHGWHRARNAAVPLTTAALALAQQWRTQTMESSSKKSGKAVYTIVDKGSNKSIWVRVGWAYVNHDGSYNIKLDALPVNGTLQVRDWEPREEWAARPRQEAASAPM